MARSDLLRLFCSSLAFICSCFGTLCGHFEPLCSCFESIWNNLVSHRYKGSLCFSAPALNLFVVALVLL